MSQNGVRDRGGWTVKSYAYLDKVNDVLNSMREYWPLTLRQVYYQLVSAGHIKNSKNQYQKLSRILVNARLEGLVSWESMEDRHRTILQSAGWSDARAFVEDETERFLTGYRRDLLQSQDMALEIWLEKDALSRIAHEVAFTYCVPVVVARGFSSISYVNECRNRVYRNGERNKGTLILYFGDLDPSGWEMLPTMMETLQREMHLGDLVESSRCALTPGQVEEYQLPHSPDALKDTDSRAKKYMEEFGDLAVELDALPPATLEELVRESIEENLDLSLFEEEQKQEADERDQIGDLRKQIIEVIGDFDLGGES